MKTLQWSKDKYTKLEPDDLLPRPAPTPEQRIRVAAAVATYIRDSNMTGHKPNANAETIRAILVMDEEAWARDMGSISAMFLISYDSEDPKTRWEQSGARSGW